MSLSGVNFNGLGSGIDFSKLTDAIIADRSRPITLLQNQSQTLGKREEALKQLNAALLKLTDASNALTDRSGLTSLSATSSDAAIVSATTSTGAATGRLNVEVTRLASPLAQASTDFAARTTPVLVGGATTATFELRKGGATSGTAFTITSSNNTLDGLRDAINTADAGVRASVVDVTGKGNFQLVLNSAETGASGRVELVETTSTGTLAALSLRTLNPPGGSSDYAELDASLKINGLSLSRPSNTVSDAVPGVTLSLKQTGTVAVELTNSPSLAPKMQAFVSAYNAIQDFVKGQYEKDGRGKPSGPLAGDQTLRTVQQQLRDAVGATVSNGGPLGSLTDLGVGRDADGKLTLDLSVLNGKLRDQPAQVQTLFFGTAPDNRGLSDMIKEAASILSDDVTGVVQLAIKGYRASIDKIGVSIEAQLQRISQLRESLTRQFSIVDAAIGQLNGQGTSLGNVLKALSPKEN